MVEYSLFVLTLHQKGRDGSSKTGKLNLADLAGWFSNFLYFRYFIFICNQTRTMIIIKFSLLYRK